MVSEISACLCKIHHYEPAGTNQTTKRKSVSNSKSALKPTDPHKAHDALQEKSENFKDCFKSKR